MKAKTEIINKTQREMLSDGWTLLGTTNDLSMLNEIKRDYTENTSPMFDEIAFTRHQKSNVIIYWGRSY